LTQDDFQLYKIDFVDGHSRFFDAASLAIPMESDKYKICPLQQPTPTTLLERHHANQLVGQMRAAGSDPGKYFHTRSKHACIGDGCGKLP
jgi:hypothetical protein